MRGHNGITLKLGKGHPTSSSAKQKLNTRISEETEVVTTCDAPMNTVDYNFIEAQGWDHEETILHQDNESAMLMKNNEKASCSKR